MEVSRNIINRENGYEVVQKYSLEDYTNNQIWIIFNMNLPHEEKVLVKDIFNVRVSQEEGDSSMLLLQNFIKQFGALGPNASLVHNSTYYDSLLMEILAVPNTDILSYLETCLARCHNVIEKPWNQTQVAQNFIKYSEEIIKNFVYLSQTQFQIFPDQLVIDADSRKIQNVGISIAMRLMTHFERRGTNMQLYEIFYPKLDDQYGANLAGAIIEVLIARQRFQTVIDGKSIFYLSVLEAFMLRPELKAQFMKLDKNPFLPAEISKVQGAALDRQSPLGVFLRLSILGHQPGLFYQQNEACKRYMEKAINDIGKEKFGRDRIKYYTDLQNEFYNHFTDVYKVFLRKQSQKAFLQWNYAAIVGNIGRTKLGSRLQGSKNSNLSPDGFLINLYVCLLNLCKPLFNIQSGKYTSINPEYFIYNQRIKLCKYERLNKKEVSIPFKNVEFGTITEFFFLAWEMLNIGVIPAHESFVQDMKVKERLQKMQDKIPLNHPMRFKLDQEIALYRTKNVLYYIVLMDQNIINPSIKLFDLLLFMLPNWLGIDYDELCDGKFVRKYQPKILQYQLPELLLDSICKFHSGVFRFKQNYLSMVGQRHVHELLKITCLVLSEENITSNPFIGAGFLETIFYFLLESKVGIMYDAFKTNAVCHRNLTYVLMKFYCDIAVTGSSHQFYEKFTYRQYVNRIFMGLWAHEVYRQNLKGYFKTQVFERFLNMVMGDTTYSVDETNEKYETYKQLEDKAQTGKLTQEQQRSSEQYSNIIQATLHQCTSNIKLIRELSKWSPTTFYSEAFLQYIVKLLNNILYTFIDPTSFVANRQLITKFKFEKDHVLSNIVQIYVNLDISDRFASEIVKDTRYYKKQHFVKALQRASNEHQTDVSTLEKFEELIGKLQTKFDDAEDEQIYGEIPDKYLCSLMSTLMKDPVQLPSGYIVDRAYIHKHLLNDERDPFTRATMKNGQWKQLKDLKDEIAVWKKKRMQELKGANKSVKYGKIGQNKKEQEEETLYAPGEKIMGYEEEN